MKGGIYSLLKAKFLIEDDALKNWKFILFLILLAMLMIANAHRYEQKTYRITELTNEVKEFRSEFVDRRSQLMELKMESTVSKEMESRGIIPSSVPPKKIRVVKEKKSFFENLWQ